MRDKELNERVVRSDYETRCKLGKLEEKIEDLANKLGYEFYDQPSVKGILRKRRGWIGPKT